MVRPQDCSIELTVGRRYGLIGQNGSGKTNFLQALAHREVRSRFSTLSSTMLYCYATSTIVLARGMRHKGQTDGGTCRQCMTAWSYQ